MVSVAHPLYPGLRLATLGHAAHLSVHPLWPRAGIGPHGDMEQCIPFPGVAWNCLLSQWGWAGQYSILFSDSNRLESGRTERETKPTAVHVHFLSAEPSLSILFGWLVGEAVSLWQIGHEQRGPQSNDQLRLSLDVVQRSSAPTPIFQSLKSPL